MQLKTITSSLLFFNFYSLLFQMLPTHHSLQRFIYFFLLSVCIERFPISIEVYKESHYKWFHDYSNHKYPDSYNNLLLHHVAFACAYFRSISTSKYILLTEIKSTFKKMNFLFLFSNVERNLSNSKLNWEEMNTHTHAERHQMIPFHLVRMLICIIHWKKERCCRRFDHQLISQGLAKISYMS